MAQNYIRQSTLYDGETITASLFNNEYNQIVNAFSYSSTDANSTGHTHDGSLGQGGNIPKIGDLDFKNKIVVDSTNNRWGVYVEVSGAAVEQVRIQDGAVVPVTTNDIDLGTSVLEFKDLFLDGTAHVDTLDVDVNAAVAGTLTVGGDLTVTGNATISGNLTFGDADTDSINLAAEIDSNIIPNTDGTYNLGSATKEWQDLYIDGTANIDSLVADTADINGGTIDGTVIGGTTAAAGSFTSVSLPDNGKAIFGDGSDLQIYHSGTHSFIEDKGTGNLYIDGASSVVIRGETANTISAIFNDAGSVVLKHNGDTKLATTATGIDITGDATFPDNGKAIFGAGSDLQIYHNAGTSFITESGSGNLKIGGENLYLQNTAHNENYLAAIANQGVTLYYNNLDKLATTSTGIDVTGTVTADGLTVNSTNNSGNTVTPTIVIKDLDTAVSAGQFTGAVEFETSDTGNPGVNSYIRSVMTGSGGAGSFKFGTGFAGSLADRVLIDDNGDISFYEDTGTTAKLFWDASAESLGIGTTSPSNSLHIQDSALNKMLITNDDYVNGSAGTSFDVSFGATSGNTYSEIRHLINGRSAWGDFVLARGGGNVGIGTSSPSRDLSLNSSGTTTLQITNDTVGTSTTDGFQIKHYTSGATQLWGYEASYMSFATNNTEAMRIDSSGNLLVGVTSTTLTGGSLTLPNSGIIAFHDAAGNARNVLQFVSGDIKHGAAGSGVTTQSFYTSNTLAATIDASGNALFGKTVANNTDAGTTIYNDNGISVVRDSNTTAIFNRLTNDGEIITIRKDGATVGSIGTNSGYVRIGTGDVNLLMHSVIDAIVPHSGSANRDAAIDLGYSGARFKDLYLSGNAIFADNGKAIFGAGSDLQIYHDGTHSYVADAGTGSLFLRSGSNIYIQNAGGTANYFKGTDGGAAELFHNGSSVLATTATGIDVTGTATMDGLTVSTATGSASPTATEATISSSTSASDWSTTSAWGVLGFYSADTSGGGAGNRAQISTNMEVATGAYSSLDFTLSNPSNAYAQDSWLKLQNSASSASRKVIVSADGGLDVTGNVHAGGSTSISEAVSGDNNAPTFIVEDSLATSIALLRSDTSIASGNSFGSYAWYGTDTTSNLPRSLAAIQALASGTHSAGDNPTDIRFLVTPDGTESLSEKMRINASGNVGIGTDSPVTNLDVRNNISMGDGTSVTNLSMTRNSANYISASDAAGYLVFRTGSSVERVRIDSSGNVGIGTTSPAQLLNLENATNPAILITDTTNTTSLLLRSQNNTSSVGTSSNHPLVFETNATEAARIDTSGKLLIGTTHNSLYNSSTQAHAGALIDGVNDNIQVARWESTPLFVNRMSTDGNLVDFRKDGAAVGIIGTVSGGLSIGSGDTGLYFESTSNEIRPFDTTANASIDAAIDLGNSTKRFKDLYLSGNVEMIHSSSGSIQMKRYDTTININNNLGQIVFGGSEDGGTTVNNSASIVALSSQNHTSTASGGYLVFNTTADNTTTLTERARIDSSGNLLVGTTDTAPGVADTNVGVALNSGRVFASAEDDYALNLNRNTNDGDIVRFRKDGTTIGSIGVDSSDNMYITSSATNHVGLYLGGGGVLPMNSGSLDSGDNVDIGSPNYQFADLHLSNSVALRNDTSVTVPAINFTDTDTSPGVAQTTGEINWTDSHSSYGNTGVKMYGQYTASGMHSFVLRTNDATTPANLETRLVVNNNGFQIYDGAGSEAARFDGSGNLLVGRTSGITFSTNTTDGVVIQPNRIDVSAASVCRISQLRDDTGTYDRFYNDENIVGSITGTTSATAYNTSSDQRLKENIADADDAGSKIDAIQVRKFDWKADGSHQDYGMVAQELQVVAPEAVSAPEDPEEMMGVDYSKLVPMMLKEIQSLRARVAQLES